MGDDGAKAAAAAAAEEVEEERSAGHSAPASPRLQRPQGLNLNPESKIPRPTSLASPVLLRRSGSLRLRGEKAARGPAGRGGFSPCTSILEGTEAWKQSLRTRGSGGDGFALPSLRQQRHHRSLQSLTSTPVRPSSVDSYPHTPTPSPEEFDHSRSHNLNRFLLDHSKEFCGERDREDLDSLRSFGSNCSTQSACDHAHFGRNGTTFSGRRMKYIVHCSSHAEPDEYLTPTQRANQQIRRLKALLEQSRKDLELKDENIFKLTKEVVELRLLRDEADGTGTKECTSTTDVTPRLAVNGEVSRVDKIPNPLENDSGTSASLSDSGHFEDIFSTMSAQSQYSPSPRKAASSLEAEKLAENYQRRIDDMTKRHSEKSIDDRRSLVEMYERKMEEMSRKLHEKEKAEKELLVEKYEKKIENILKEQEEKRAKVQREIIIDSEKNENLLRGGFECENQLLVAKYEGMMNDLQKRHEDSHQLLKDAHFSEVTSLKHQLQEANNRCGDLQQELFQARERIVELEEEIEILQTSLKQQKVAQDNFEKKILDNYTEEQKNADLRHKQLLQERSQLEGEITDLKDSIRSLENKLEKADSWKNEASDQSSEINDLKAELDMQLNVTKSSEAQHKREIECLKLKLCEAGESNMIKLNQLKTYYESSLAKFQRDLSDSKKMAGDLETENHKLQRQLENSQGLHQEIHSLKTMIVGHKEELEKSKAEAVALKSEMEFLLQNLAQKDEELNIRSQSLCQLEQEILFLRKSVSECNEKNQELLVKKKELERERENLQELHSELDSLREIVAQKEKQCNELIEKLSKVNAEVAAVKDLKSQELVSHVQRSHQLEEHVHSLKKELSKYKELHDHLTEYSEGLRLELENQQTGIDAFKEIVNQKEKDCKESQAECREATAKIVSLENEVAILKQHICQKDQEIASNVERSGQLKTELHSLQKIVSQYEEGKKELTLTKEKLKEEQELLSRLQSQIEALRQLVQQGEKHLEVSNENVSSLKADINSLKLQVNQKDQALLETFQRSHQLQREASSLQKRIADLENEYEELLKTKDTCKTGNQAQDLRSDPHPSSLLPQHSRDSLNDIQRIYQDLLLERHKTDSLKKEIESLKSQVCTSCHNNSETGTALSERLSTKEGDIMEKDTTQVDEVAWLQAEVQSLKQAFAEQEERHNEINLKMHTKGQEAAQFEHKDEVSETGAHASNKRSVPELLSQLAETEKELEKVKVMYRRLAEGQASNSSSPEATLLFLKSAFYYFLTDEANCQGHLNAIQSILGFTESEKQAVDTRTYFRR